MDLQKRTRAALVLALTLSFASSAAWAEKTLWLVRPLYPGQETLVERTEKALDKLMPGDARKDSVIGKAELANTLKAQVVTELPCFSADNRCADPIDPFVANLGFERIVLIQGGQDEAGFKFRVVAYEPKTGKVNPATASNANLEKALLGALAKVVPAASTLDVKSNPSGATVFVDDVKVGVTPLNTQVLPGERVIRLDLKLHQPVEETIVIPIRGAASLEKTLEKVAARIVITASPPGTEIFIDGAAVGKDKVDRGIVPGEHVIRLTAEKHKAFEQTISVKADQQYSLDKTLEPLPGALVKDVPPRDDKVAVLIKNNDPPPPPPAPKPSTPADQIYERRSYFHASFEVANLDGSRLVGRRFDTRGFGRTTSFITPGRTLVGASVEYGTFGKYFGISVFGLSYLTNIDPWRMNVGFTPNEERESSLGVPFATSQDSVRANIFVLRALQPQVRLAVWRFQFSLQLGLEFRTGQITGLDPGQATTQYKDGFVPLDLLLAGRFNVRFFIADGFFLHLQGNYTWYLIGERATDETGTLFASPNSFGFNGGVGYGF
ncbi:MAG: PEGA domain-containing protein [Archangium sp.]|nr:PEGA domain-containing protein [Archangium sp.]